MIPTGLAAVGIHAEMLRNRMERAEESLRFLHEVIASYARGSKLAEAYLQKVGKIMENWE